MNPTECNHTVETSSEEKHLVFLSKANQGDHLFLMSVQELSNVWCKIIRLNATQADLDFARIIRSL